MRRFLANSATRVSSGHRIPSRLSTLCLALLGSAALGMFLLIATPVAQAAEQRGPFRDCAECPEMVPVPVGAFVMGTPSSTATPDEAIAGAEAMPTVVRITKPFALSRVEITRAQYRLFVADAAVDPGTGCKTWDPAQGRMILSRSRTFANPGVPAGARNDWPVSCVSWNDAKAYVQWLARKTGKAYRLASEAEWEYAARAGSSTLRPWGDAPADGCEYANTFDASTRAVYALGTDFARCQDGFADVAPVGSLRPNAFGLNDMIGNVAEWVEDCYTDSYVNRPRDNRAWVWLGGCNRHVIRGGSWLSPPSVARSGARDSAPAQDRADSVGFRIAVDLDTRAERGQ